MHGEQQKSSSTGRQPGPEQIVVDQAEADAPWPGLVGEEIMPRHETARSRRKLSGEGLPSRERTRASIRN